MRRASILAVAAVLAIPGHSRADTNDQLAAKVVALVEVGASVVEANRNDCNAMGDTLSRMVADNASFIDDVRARSEKVTPSEMRTLTARYQSRLEAAMTKAKPGLDCCRSNAKVAAVLRKLGQ